jgi:hypothetical protein
VSINTTPHPWNSSRPPPLCVSPTIPVLSLSNLSLPVLYLSSWRLKENCWSKEATCLHPLAFIYSLDQLACFLWFVFCGFIGRSWCRWRHALSCLRSRSWLCEASRVALLPWLWCIILQYLWIFYVFGSGINHVTVTKILCSHIILRVGVPGSWICVFLMFIYSFSEFYIVCLILCIIIVTKWTVTLWPIVCVIVSQVRIHESELKCWFKRNFVGLIFIRFFSIALCLYA